MTDQRPESAGERRVAATTSDIDERAQREVSNLKEIIATQHDAMQQEIDRRFESAGKDHDNIAVVAHADLNGLREFVEGQIGVLEARLDGMDRANVVLQETVTRVPTDVQLQVGNLRDVMEERFKSIDKQFNERDIRSEREARDNKVAVDAAFAAQKDSATQTDAANAKAIEKSETATTKTIDTLGAVITSSNKALSDKIDDLKARVQAIESTRIGGRERTQQSNASLNVAVGVMGVVLAVILVSLAIFAAVHG